MEEPHIKGVAFRSFVTFLERSHGEAAVQATLDGLEGELALMLRDGMLFTGNWYPLAWYRQLHRAAQRATGGGLELARAKGYAGVAADLSGIYRIFLAVVSPEFVITRAARLFSTYYDTGTMEVVSSTTGQARARWTDCGGFDRNVWSDVLGGCEAALTAAGAREVQLRVVGGGGEDDDHLEVDASWT